MEKEIKVAICDDAVFLCEGFKEMFSYTKDIRLVAMAHSAASCSAMIKKAKPDILLLDIRMEREQSGIDIIPELKKEYPELKIIMLTSYSNDDYIFAAFANGAEDYCEKKLEDEEVIETVRNVYNNTCSLRPEIAQKLVKKTQATNRNQQSLLFLYNKIFQLSSGEFELLREMYYGGSYKKIAEEKYVEIDSVRKMAKRLLKKMEADSMNDLIIQLKELRIFELISPPEL